MATRKKPATPPADAVLADKPADKPAAERARELLAQSMGDAESDSVTIDGQLYVGTKTADGGIAVEFRGFGVSDDEGN